MTYQEFAEFCRKNTETRYTNIPITEIPLVLFEMVQLETLHIKRRYRTDMTPYKERSLADLVLALPDGKVIW
jgi:hypothetical protein